MRLDMKSKMEVEYIDEIDSLRAIVETQKQQLHEKHPTEPLSDHGDTVFDTTYTTVEILNQIEQLQSELGLSQKKVSDLEIENRSLRERIDILEISKECSVLNSVDSSHTDELLNEIEGFKAQILVEKSEKQRIHQLLIEKTEDFEAAVSQISELQATVKTLREEICDANAELEGLRLAAGTTSDTRGNSLFSEVEDRRRRAETLVQKQQAFIDELQLSLANVRMESRKKILHLQQEMEANAARADSQIIEELFDSNRTLGDEVSRLRFTLNNHKDKKLDELRQADQLAQAFRPDQNGHRRLIKALEERLIDYRCKADKAHRDADSLSQRFFRDARQRHDLNQELAQQKALANRLSAELQFLHLSERGGVAAGNGNKENTSGAVQGDSKDSTSPLPDQNDKIECRQS